MQHSIPQSQLVRAVDRVPSEILSDIFRQTGSGSGIVLGKAADSEVWPWNVALACKRWYGVVLEDRRLWSVVTLRLIKWNDWETLRSPMLKCLEKSSPCDLKLRIRFPETLPPDQGVIRDLEQIIAPIFFRLVELTVNHLCGEELYTILSLASALESCRVSDSLYLPPRSVSATNLIEMASMRRLILRKMAPWPIFYLRAPTLTFLQIDLIYVDPLPETWTERIRIFLDQSNAALAQVTIKGIMSGDTERVTGLLESEQSLKIVKLCVLDTSTLITFVEWFLKQRILSLEKLYLVSYCLDGPTELRNLWKRLTDIGVAHPIRNILSITLKNVSGEIAAELKKNQEVVPLVRIMMPKVKHECQ